MTFTYKMYKNLTYKTVVPIMKSMFYIKDNKLVSDVEEIQCLTKVSPDVKKELIAANDFQIGIINETGHYSGLIGYIQRLEADLVYYPIPMNIYEPPGIFTGSFIESGTKILTITTSTHKKNNDISEFFLYLDPRLVLLILLNFIVLTLLIYKLSKFSLTLSETIYLLYQSLLKEQVLNKFCFKKPLFIIALLFYHHALSILIEANVNTNLVVHDTPHYINSLKDLYEDKEKQPYFVKEHFSNDYFTNKYKNKVADTIYKRAENNDCIIEAQEIVNKLFFSSSKKTDFAVLTESSIIVGFRNMLCYNKHNLVNNIGSSHLSNEIYKVHFGNLFKKSIDKIKYKFYNQKIYYSTESGLMNNCFKKFDFSTFGLPKNTDPGFKKCLYNNEIETIQSSFYTIKLNNVKYLLIIYFLSFAAFLIFFSKKFKN